MTTAPRIELQGLGMNYSPKTAGDHGRLHLCGGEISDFPGPNGAEKTTAIKLLLDHASPTGGYTHVVGHDIQKESIFIHNRIGQPLTSVTTIIGTTLICLVFTVITIPRFEREEF